jgi:uncharacterized membrane protein YdjX (TVP38/TMEM64 family)
MSRETLLKIGLLFLLSVLISLSLQRFFHIGLSDIQDFVTSAGIWAPLVYALILFLGLSIPFNPISDSITVSIAALVFPPIVAILMTFVAHTIALTVNYWIAREFGLRILRRLLSKSEVKKIEDLGPRIHPGWIFGFRFLLPLNAIGFDFISYAAGIARMDFKKFFFSSIIPWTILSIAFFSSASLLREVNPGLIFLPIVILVVIPSIYFASRRKENIWDRIKNFFKR